MGLVCCLTPLFRNQLSTGCELPHSHARSDDYVVLARNALFELLLCDVTLAILSLDLARELRPTTLSRFELLRVHGA